MIRAILTLTVMAATLTTNLRAADETNRFMLHYGIRDAVFDHTKA
jgi:hypothetical protein